MSKNRNNKKKGMSIHHFLWSEKDWNKGRSCRLLRSHFYCKCYLKRASDHNKIHQAISHVPTLSAADASLVLDYLNYASRQGSIDRGDSTWQKLSYLIRILDNIGEKKTKKALIKQRDILFN